MLLNTTINGYWTTCLFTSLWWSLRVGADITVLREREVDYDSEEPRKIAEVLVRKVPDDQQVSNQVKVKAHQINGNKVQEVECMIAQYI